MQNSELQRAITTIAQGDPIIKLVQEVRYGRKRPDDPGLRAVTESWLAIYSQVLESSTGLEREALMRLDPSPRLEVLFETGILKADHPAVKKLRGVFDRRIGGESAQR